MVKKFYSFRKLYRTSNCTFVENVLYFFAFFKVIVHRLRVVLMNKVFSVRLNEAEALQFLLKQNYWHNF